MKYKAEVWKHRNMKYENYYNRLTHPNQVVRNVVSKLKNKMNYYLIVVANDSGEVWKYSVMKKPDEKLYIRKIDKAGNILNRDEIDMVFTGNRTIII